MTGSTTTLRAGLAALLAQLALQIAWHAFLVPQSRAALALAVLPLLPPLWVCRRNLRRGVLVGCIVSLFYLCHGIAEWWSANGQRVAAAAEVAACMAAFAALIVDARRQPRHPG